MRRLFGALFTSVLLASCSPINPSADGGMDCQNCDDAGTTGGGAGGGGGGSNTGGGSTTGGGGGGGSVSMTDGGTDAGPPALRTLTDYRSCTSDGDCPVGLGRCLFELPLNRLDAAGRSALPINEVFPALGPGEGICSLPCTTTPEVCGTLTLQGTSPDTRPHVCQVVATVSAPYPSPRPAFPFDGQLVTSELTRGVPYVALCRPPFELAPTVIDAFCSSCTGAASCAGGLCFDALSQGAADGGMGLCLAPCGSGDACPRGFTCSTLAGGSYCRPLLDTCTLCSDVDHDGRGAGRCGPATDPVTPYDCDDHEARAWFDPVNPSHAFPAWCGANDFNCNGLSDDAEQIGSVDFGSSHCTACADRCSGPLPNSARRCVQLSALDGGSAPSCQPACNLNDAGFPAFANCDNTVSTGCEVPVNDPSRVYYRDSDGDGRGDPANPLFACVPSSVTSGYVQNSSDCNDTRATVYGPGPAGAAAVEVCDGFDNDCDTVIDDGVLQVGDPCSVPGGLGACLAGTKRCMGSVPLICVSVNQPAPEACNDGVDNDCNGQIDEATAVDAGRWYIDSDLDTFGASPGAPTFPNSDAGTIPTNIVSCTTKTVNIPGVGTRSYVASGTDCNDRLGAIKPTASEICDAVDNDCDSLIDDLDPSVTGQKTWAVDYDQDGVGTQVSTGVSAGGRPVRTIACFQPAGYADLPFNDCNDNNAAMSPLLSENCSDSVDNNCNGTVNELGPGVTNANAFYQDLDQDTHGNPNVPNYVCGFSPPPGYVSSSDDCNDGSGPTDLIAKATWGGISPAPEQCDGANNDCSSLTSTDRGCPTMANTSFGGGSIEAGRIGNLLTAEKVDECPNGHVVVGFTVYANSWIDAITPICGPQYINRITSTVPYQYFFSTYGDLPSLFAGGGSILPRRGSTNTGTQTNFLCPAGTVVTKLHGEWSGSFVELYRMSITCTPLLTTAATNTGLQPVMAVMGTTGGSVSNNFGSYMGNQFADSDCGTVNPNGNRRVAVGTSTSSADVISGTVNSVRLRCRDLVLPVIP